MEDFGRDFVAGVLEVHDGVGDLQPDRDDDGLDVERPQQPVGQDLDRVWKKKIDSVTNCYKTSDNECPKMTRIEMA